MASTTFQKREKETKRREKAKEKEARRVERSKDRPVRVAGGEDPDLVGITAGPHNVPTFGDDE